MASTQTYQPISSQFILKVFQMARAVLSNEWVLVLLVTVAALSLRLVNLKETMAFTYDQGRDMLVLAEMAAGDIKLVGPTTGLNGVFLGPFMYYLLLPGFIFSNGSPFGVQFWQAVLVTATLPLYYLILKQVTGLKWLALMGLIMLSFTPGSIGDARMIWNPSLAAAVLIVMMWAAGQVRSNPWWLVTAGFAGGLLLQTEVAYAVFLIPAFGVWLVNLLLKKKISWIHASAGAGSFLVTLLPQLAFELKHNWIMTKSLVGHFSSSEEQSEVLTILSDRPFQIISAVKGYLFGGLPHSEWIVLMILLGSFLLLSRWKQASKKSEQYLLWFAICWLPILGLLFYTGNQGHFFEYYLQPHYLPLLTLTILMVTELPRVLRRPATGLLLMLWIVVFGHFARIILQPEIFGYTIQHQISALKHVEEQSPATGIDVFVPNLQPTQYQYLYVWMKQEGELKGVSDRVLGYHDTFYLISEPAYDDGSKVAYQEWDERMTDGASCLPSAEFGIIQVRECVR